MINKEINKITEEIYGRLFYSEYLTKEDRLRIIRSILEKAFALDLDVDKGNK